MSPNENNKSMEKKVRYQWLQSSNLFSTFNNNANEESSFVKCTFKST